MNTALKTPFGYWVSRAHQELGYRPDKSQMSAGFAKCLDEASQNYLPQGFRGGNALYDLETLEHIMTDAEKLYRELSV